MSTLLLVVVVAPVALIISSVDAAGQSPRSLPPERRPYGSNVTGITRPLEYWDAALDAPNTPREVEPIDQVIDWMKSGQFSCLGTQQVVWNAAGTQGIARDNSDVRERYVIECVGNCKDLRYIPGVSAAVFHFGATQPVPVMEIRNVTLGTKAIRWTFTREGTSNPPDVYVHRWSNAGMLNGQSCRAPSVERSAVGPFAPSSSAEANPAGQTAAAAPTPSPIDGRWVIRRDSRGFQLGIDTVTILVQGRNLTASGLGWRGEGEFDGRNGYYEWSYGSGRSGRTEFVLENGELRGQVRQDGRARDAFNFRGARR